MSRGEAFKSRADDEFAAALTGQRRPPGAPSGLVITEGPFATPVADPIAFRRHQMSEDSAPATGTYAKRAHVVDAAEAAVVSAVGGPMRVTPAPEVKTAAASDDNNSDGPGRVSRPEVISRGSSPIQGSDVGELPPADTRPMTLSTAPEKGKRAPAPSAKQVTQNILKTLGRRGPVPASDLSVSRAPTGAGDGDARDKQPANDGRDRMSLTNSGPNGAELHTGFSREKVGTVLRAVGAPASMVTEDSILWSAACEKIAAVVEDDDAGDYVTRDDTHPMALFTHLGTRYGDEWLGWDLEVVQQTLAADLGRDPSTATMNKIAALQLLTKKPETVYGDWHVFEKVAVAFDGAAPRLTLIEDLSPEQMAFAASVMRMAAPDPRPVAGWTFSRDMQKYCAARLFDAGLIVAPPELGFCDAELATLASEQGALRKAAMTMYAAALRGKEPRDIDQDAPPADFVQAARLMRIHAYVLDKIDDLVRQAL